MTKFYVDPQGNYIGGFDGASPPAGSAEVPSPPVRADDKWVNGAWSVQLASAVAAFIRRVDTDVDAIYAAAVGNRNPEYVQANSDASAFKTASYTGTVPASVSSWATAKGWTAQAAADDIIAAAARLASARDSIRSNRLLRKEDARKALTIADLTAAQSAWVSFVVTIRAQLGV